MGSGRAGMILIPIDGKTSRRTHDKRKGLVGVAHAQRPSDVGATERA